MSQAQAQDQDEARAARIAKYKEERRRELTARTAVIFSNNVTDRRQRTNASRKTEKEAPKSPAKSASELNLSAASTSVPIRTTRTSRLRAAAATHSDSSLTLKKSNRSSSVQSLEDTKKKPSRILDRDKIKAPIRRQSNEKENLKAVPTADGAIRKPKHSINKNLLDTSKTKSSLTSKGEKPKLIDDKKRRSITVEKKADVVKTVKAQDLKTKESKKVFGETDTSLIDVEKEKVEDLFDSLVADDNQLVPNLKVNNGKNEETKTSIPNLSVAEVASKVLDSDVPNDENEEGLFGVMCVPKVQRFSELLSNLCSPREAELLFEDILVENGIEGNGDSRKSSPECTAPCRRSQPTSRPASTPKRALVPISLNGSSDDGMVGMDTLELRRKLQLAIHYYGLLRNRVDNPSALSEVCLTIPKRDNRCGDMNVPPRRRIALFAARPTRLVRTRNAPTQRALALLGDFLTQYKDADIFFDSLGTIHRLLYLYLNSVPSGT